MLLSHFLEYSQPPEVITFFINESMEEDDYIEEAMRAIGENFRGILNLYFVHSHDNYVPLKRGFMKSLEQAE